MSNTVESKLSAIAGFVQLAKLSNVLIFLKTMVYRESLKLSTCCAGQHLSGRQQRIVELIPFKSRSYESEDDPSMIRKMAVYASLLSQKRAPFSPM
jgi:hypothetical protein